MSNSLLIARSRCRLSVAISYLDFYLSNYARTRRDYTLESSRPLAIAPRLAIYERDANPRRLVARVSRSSWRAATLNAAAAIIRWPLKTCPLRGVFRELGARGVKTPTHNTPCNLFVRTCRVKYTHNVDARRRDAPVPSRNGTRIGEKAKESEYPADLRAIDGPLASVYSGCPHHAELHLKRWLLRTTGCCENRSPSSRVRFVRGIYWVTA